MSECLVTTLKGAITDSSLLRLGELKIKVTPTTLYNIGLTTQNPVTASIVSDGYFTDSTGTANLGKTATTQGNVETHFYLNPGEYDIVFSNKYDFMQVGFARGTYNIMSNDLSDYTGCKNMFLLYNSGDNVTGNLKKFVDNVSPDFTHLYLNHTKVDGTLADLSQFTQMITLSLSGSTIRGNISALSVMRNLRFLNADNTSIEGDISSLSTTMLKTLSISSSSGNSAITGNISSLTGLTDMEFLNLGRTAVSGNLSSLASLTKLTSLNLNSTNVVGDTSDLASLTLLTTFTYTNTAITGTWPLT